MKTKMKRIRYSLVLATVIFASCTSFKSIVPKETSASQLQHDLATRLVVGETYRFKMVDGQQIEIKLTRVDELFIEGDVEPRSHQRIGIDKIVGARIQNADPAKTVAFVCGMVGVIWAIFHGHEKPTNYNQHPHYYYTTGFLF